MKMENAEEIFHFLEEFSKRKPKTIPQELNDYLAYVARTGDPVYQWSLVKCLFKEKLINVITDFYETTSGIDIPPYPNVDPFNYDTMKNSLLERLDSFTSAPFTVQRISELLTYPRKQYNRVDKFMRAIEKNILVVSTREPGVQRHIEAENGEPMEPIVNGTDHNSEYNVDVEMEDMSWKENSEPQQSSEPQPSSSDTHISVDDIEARLKAKQEAPMDTQDKVATQYESVTPPELNVTTDKLVAEPKSVITTDQQPSTSVIEEQKPEAVAVEIPDTDDKPKMDVEMKLEGASENQTLIIPEIKVEDAEMTEQRLTEQVNSEKTEEKQIEKETVIVVEDQQPHIDESSSDSNSKEELENKLILEVHSSSEESSSSSDNTDGNSNSPKPVESQGDVPEESSQSDSNMEEEKEEIQLEPEKIQPEPEKIQPEPEKIQPEPEKIQPEPEKIQPEPEKIPEPCIQDTPPVIIIESDNYSISDVKSELPQPIVIEPEIEEPVPSAEEPKVVVLTDEEQKEEQLSGEDIKSTEVIIENPSS